MAYAQYLIDLSWYMTARPAILPQNPISASDVDHHITTNML